MVLLNYLIIKELLNDMRNCVASTNYLTAIVATYKMAVVVDIFTAVMIYALLQGRFYIHIATCICMFAYTYI